MENIFVFNGSDSSLPSGLFSEFELAKKWIEKYGLTGILTAYPINIGLYDWAIENHIFDPKKDYQTKARFIQTFTCASVEHYHFENGILEA